MAVENRRSRLEKRLWSELEDVRTANMKDIYDIQVDNVWKWHVFIVPHCSPYDKGAFRIEMIISDDYPFKSPKILFHTKIYHPKVDEEGYIHLEILSKYWSPLTQMEQVFRCLIGVVNKPYYISVESEEEFIEKAIEMTKNFSERRPDDTDRPIPKEVGKIANRLRIELEEIKAANMKCFEKIRVNDIWKWNGLLVPDCAPYNKGAFRFEVNIPPEYPHAPPKIYFRTKIYHPNVTDSGEVDMRETCTEWNSTRKMIDVFQALRRLLSEPDTDHFRFSEVTELYAESRETFLRVAEEFVKQFAEKLSSEEFPEPEGKCLPFVDTIEKIIVPVKSFDLEEGKCLEVKLTENAVQELKQLSDDFHEPIGNSSAIC
ncbi:uncharacterized protein [Parasteatoda tepidariorum]|uniref:uncharacterized protein n=1 Tax=Parasteatoda tepidariorum TaxID=114398 RepID=UPI00077FD026|nr:uncharacterized protein LOC107450504 [Parasteatoda tepidariorum]